MRIGKTVLACLTVVGALAAPVVRADAARSDGVVLRGAITFVDDAGVPTPVPVGTCAAVARDRLTVRGPGVRASGRLHRVDQLADLEGSLCKVTFSVQAPRHRASYVLFVRDKQLGRWSRAEIATRDGWLFLTVRGRRPSSWRVDELTQVHQHVAVPKNPETLRGVPFDPAEWQQEWTTIPGTDDGRCAPVRDRTSVRAGSFLAGNFASYRDSWSGSVDRSKLWYVPLDPGGRPPLTVVAQHLDSTGVPVGDAVPVLVDAGEAWTPGGAFFYASSTLIPERGPWRLTVTAGANRGCFDFEL